MDFNDDDIPPPYSTLDPLQLQGSSRSAPGENAHEENNTNSTQLENSLSSLHINEPSPSTASDTAGVAPTISSVGSEIPAESSSSTLSTNFASAGGYFAERSLPASIAGDTKLETLVHHMTIYSRTQSKDFPRRPRCWNSRGSEINQHDWDTFLNFLFPSHLGPAASSDRLHASLRAEIGRDRKDRAQETDEQRSARINEVIEEWNNQFFDLRGVHVTWRYVADLEEGPVSSLCPSCYPQATDPSRLRGKLVRRPSDDAPIPVDMEEPPAGPANIQRRPVPQAAQTAPLPPQNASASPPVSAITAPVAPGQIQNFPIAPFDNRRQSGSFWKSNPATWASQMTSIAQQYAAKISNQAQEYSRSIEESALARSKQVELYSKKMEENALARARQLETMALTQGRRVENAGGRFSNWATGRARNSISSVHSIQSQTQPSTITTTEARQFANEPLPRQQSPRRLSTASDKSISSISSIDTVSTMSDLEPDDLRSVREQLSSLNEYHHHELYDAAVSLRTQLEVLKKSRVNSRVQSQRARPWGQWDSPAEATDREQRGIAMKRESKLLREEFNEVERRARREVRELKKAKKEARKQQRSRPSSLRPQQQQHYTFPGAAMPDTGSNLYKETLVQGASESLNRTTSEPIWGPDDIGRSTVSSPAPSTTTTDSINPHEAAKAWTEAQRTKVKDIKKANKERIKENEKAHKKREKQQQKGKAPIPPSSNPDSVDPHEAAKAWTEAQRTKVKDIQRANKERLKEIQKAHKEREKEERKAIKRLSKQKHTSITRMTSTSSSTTLPETGTIQSSGSVYLEKIDDDIASSFSREDDETTAHGSRETGTGGRAVYHEIGVIETETPELDGHSL